MRQNHVSNPAATTLWVFSDFTVLAACYFGTLFWTVRDATPWEYVRDGGGWLQISVQVGVIQIGFYFTGLYGELQSFSVSKFIQQLLLVLGASFLVQALIGYGQWESLQLPQWVMLSGSALVLVLLPAWRKLFFGLIRSSLLSRRLLLVGQSFEVDAIRGSLESRVNPSFSIAGITPSFAEYEAAGFESNVDRIVVAQEAPFTTALPVQALLDARLYGIQVESAANFYEQLFGRVSLASLQPWGVLADNMAGRPAWIGYFQSVYSRILALVFLLIAAIPMLIIAVLLRLTSSEPVFAPSRFVGQHGKVFTGYQFRTHTDGSLTRAGLGRWLDSSGLARLPLFWSVLHGDMNLVGPELEHVDFCGPLQENVPFHQLRHSVPPGLTGWAQINRGAERIPMLTELEYDLYYLKRRDAAMDLYILFHSIPLVFSNTSQSL